MANPVGKVRLETRAQIMKVIRDGNDEGAIRRALSAAAPRPLRSYRYRIWREEVRRALGPGGGAAARAA